MSCIPNIPSKLTRAQIREAKKQRLNYTSPAPRPSLFHRLEKMAVDPNYKIRERAALDPKLSLTAQWTLAMDKVNSVRVCLARNKNTDPLVLSWLSSGEIEAVRGFVALNEATRETTLKRLSIDTSETVRNLANWSLVHYNKPW